MLIIESNFLIAIIFGCIAYAAGSLILALFHPGLRYKIHKVPPQDLSSEGFRRTLEALCDAHIYNNTHVEVLANGENFYEAELEAISRAKHSINLEAYIFGRGELTRRFISALAERARAGIKVNLVIDAIGSFTTTNNYFKELTDADGRVAWYHSLKWYTWTQINNRTHRELIIIDGSIGFIGGAGFADHWIYGKPKHPRWRDTMYRVEGEAVSAMQSTFAENWLEASGEILIGEEYHPYCKSEGKESVMIINSAPSPGMSTRARMLFQTLVASATQSIEISTPYFLPDWSARQELVRAIRERGVKVTILTPGKKSDHVLTRRSSRRLYGELLKAGASIYEYEPSMIHVKTLVVDQLWTVVGSTNFDPRSFGLNDEVNMAACSDDLAARARKDFFEDIRNSRKVVLKQWRTRPITERMHEWVGWLLERQQ